MDDGNDEVFFSGPSGFFVTIEQGEQVCWAYLVDSDMKVLADVWLHNCQEAPDYLPWHRSSKPPFMNPKKFTVESEWAGRRIAIDTLVSVKWRTEPFVEASIFYGAELVAIVAIGEKPGRCRFAAVDGPQAKVLTTV